MAYGHPKTAPALLICIGAAYVYRHYLPPAIVGGTVQPAGALAVFICVIAGLNVAANVFSGAADMCRWRFSTRIRHHKSSGGWATSIREIKSDLLLNYEPGPYWGVFGRGFWSVGTPVFSEFKSNSVVFGVAGSGKGVGILQPTILSIHDSKIIPDFKGVNTCCLANALRERGEIVRIVNLGAMHEDILGKATDRLNPLDVIISAFLTPGSLRDVVSDIAEMAQQLLSDPVGGSGQNAHFYEGSRKTIGFCIQQCVLVRGKNATLGDVLQMLNAKTICEDALWAAGLSRDDNGELLPAMPLEDLPWTHLHDAQDVADYITYYRGLAASIVGIYAGPDSKAVENFLTAAQNALHVFNVSARPHKVLRDSTFCPSELKTRGKPCTLFLIIDNTRMETMSVVASLLQWMVLTMLKRHANKDVPVYLIADETTNFKIFELPKLQTYGREYGIRWQGYIQSIAAYEDTFGKPAVSTLLSETEIKIFLPGQRDQDMLDLIQRMLGEQAINVQSCSNNRDGQDGNSFGKNASEDSRPLMTADEIRRTDKAILIIRRQKPMLVDLPPISAIHPYRTQIDVNPFYGKPYLERIRLWLKPRKKPPA